MKCPCGGGLYDECCKILHDGKPAADAKQLMRSRYTAFCLRNVDYIIATTAPAQQPFLDKSALSAWADEMNWVGLDVISHTPKVGKHHAQVHFCAYFDNGQGKQVHDELSTFVKTDGVWYFLDPTVPTPTNKQPCLCGSGAKFKACCGKFL